MLVSDCCGVGIMFGDICQRCKEHCDVVNDETGEYVNEMDYIPGYDDGEACGGEDN